MAEDGHNLETLKAPIFINTKRRSLKEHLKERLSRTILLEKHPLKFTN